MFYDFDKAVTREEALRLMKEQWNPAPEIEKVPLTESIDRVAAETLCSVNTLPVYRVSSFDGFAVRSEDFANGIPDTKAWVRGVNYVPADTGDDFPDEFDTIVAVEDMHFDEDGHFCLNDDFKFVKGEAVRPAGSMMRTGDLLIEKNTVITPEHLAALAMGGIVMVPVYRKPRVAFLPTGSELINAGIRPERGQNIECNSILLSAYLKKWGAEPICFPIVKDNRAQLEAELDEAVSMADIVIINGGTSKGTEDFNSHLLEEKSTFFRHGVRAVPGRPIGMGIIDGKPVLNIPGPVLAAWLASDWLLHGLICHYFSIPMPRRQKVTGMLTEELKKGRPFEMLGRVKIERSGDDYLITPITRKAGAAESLTQAGGFLIVPIGCAGYPQGERVTVELLRGEELL